MDQYECSSCGENYESHQLFRCSSCAEKQDTADTSEKMCESCIVPHIRKHAQDVIDSKGNKPLICLKHKVLRLQYCMTCDVAFCWQCLGSHSEHKFQTLSEKDKELKKHIHETLTDLETVKEKPLRLKKDSVSKTVEQKRLEVLKLKDFIDKELNKIKSKTHEMLDRKLDGITAEENKLNTSVIDLGNMQAKCRSLLGMSTAAIIETLPNVRSELEELNTTYQLSMKTEIKLNVVADHTLVPYFEDLWFKIEQAIKNEKTDILLAGSSGSRSSTKSENLVAEESASQRSRFFCHLKSPFKANSVYEIKKEPCGRIKVSLLDCSGVKHQIESSYSHRVSPELNIVEVFGVSDNEFLIKYDNDSLLVFDRSKHSFKDAKQPAIAISYPLWPYKETYYGRKTAIYHWSYWDEERKKIKFTLDDQFEIECEKKPFIKMNSISLGPLCFVDVHRVIIRVSPWNRSFETIQPTLHKVESIDCISPSYSLNCLFVWSASTKSATFLHKSKNQYQLSQIISWRNQPEIFEMKIKLPNGERSIRLFPSIKPEDDLNEEEHGVFAVFVSDLG